AARSRHARDVTACQRIEINSNYNDRYEAARAYDCLQGLFRPGSDNQVRRRAHQFRNGDEGPAGIIQSQIINGEVLTFAEAEVCQSCAEGLILGGRWRVVERRTQVAKADDLAGLLAAYHERPCRQRTAEQRDELAPSHSITSSARASSEGGTSR